MAIKLRKGQPEKGKLKVCLYGNFGCGKSATALLLAEYLAKRENKQIAYIDTEHSIDFYLAANPARKWHPEKFEVHRDVSRSILDVRDFLQTIDPTVYGVVVLDSITHLWESAKEIYSGRMTSQGGYPIQAWGPIKRPWKQMMEAGINGQFHFIICGRLGNVFEENDEGKMESRGTRVKAEGEAGYEPDILGHLFQQREGQRDDFVIRMFIEKDRSSVLMGKTIDWPNGETFAPIYELLAGEHGGTERNDDMVARDVAKLETEQENRDKEKNTLFQLIRRGLLEAADHETLGPAWEMAKGKKTRLGEELWEQLVSIKEAQKASINQRSSK